MENSINGLQVSIWLLPQEAKSLVKDIKTLAQKFKAPEFVPHLTLYSTKIPAENLTLLKENLKSRIKGFNIITLNILGVGQNGTLFKTLFLQLQNSKQLIELYKTVESILGKYGSYELDPHLSLLYKEGLTSEEKVDLAENIKFGQEIKFDKVAIKVSGENDNFGKDINKWTYEILN